MFYQPYVTDMDYLLFQGELPIFIVQEYEVSSFAMGYHEYRKTWAPFLGEILQCRMEPHNAVDRYAVAAMNKDRVVGHLMKGKSGKFAKTVFFFLRTDEINSATVKITRKAVNKGKGMGMEVPCSITFTGSKPMLGKLKEILYQLQ